MIKLSSQVYAAQHEGVCEEEEEDGWVGGGRESSKKKKSMQRMNSIKNIPIRHATAR